METRTIYRDGVDEKITGPIKIRRTREGHTVEAYKTDKGMERFFVTLAGTHWCAHGDSVAAAVADATWKDPEKRPSKDALKKEIQRFGKTRKLTLNEFRVLTGACLSGCRHALAAAGRDETPLTAHEIHKHISKEWGGQLLSILEWSHE